MCAGLRQDGRDWLVIRPGSEGVGRLLLVESIGQPADGRSDLVDGLSAFGRVVEHRLDLRAFSRLELAEHVGGQSGVVRVKGHGESSSEASLGRLAIEQVTPQRLDPGVDQVADV